MVKFSDFDETSNNVPNGSIINNRIVLECRPEFESFNMTDEERDTKIGGQITLGFSIVGGIAAMVVGYLADKVNRRNLFVAVILIGELSCFFTLFVTTYAGLFATRAVTGVSIGGANPLIMSMIGDMFEEAERGKAVSFIQIMLSLGIALGQAVAGFVGPEDALGWRAPFVVIAIPTFILAPIFLLTTKDPPRGGKERSVMMAASTEIGHEGDGDVPLPDQVYEERMDCSKVGILLRNKTAVLGFLQGIPGSLPWGVMLVFFQDFLVQDIGPYIDGGISVQESTVVVLTFGAGAGLGIVIGGFLADRLWKRSPAYVPILMAVTTCMGALPLYGLINGPPTKLVVYAVVTLPCGCLASITGTAIRMVLMNVTLPEMRGTAFAFHTFFDDIGRGVGPLWVSILIQGTGGRVPGFNYSLAGWFVCSVILALMTCTIKPDLKKQQEGTAAAMERYKARVAAMRDFEADAEQDSDSSTEKARGTHSDDEGNEVQTSDPSSDRLTGKVDHAAEGDEAGSGELSSRRSVGDDDYAKDGKEQQNIIAPEYTSSSSKSEEQQEGGYRPSASIAPV